MRCDVDLRSTLFANLVIAGGTSGLKKFCERIYTNLTKITHREIKIKLTAPKNRTMTCWIGGSTLASLKAFNEIWITRADYTEAGPNIFRQYA